jgi:hypothetical protein
MDAFSPNDVLITVYSKSPKAFKTVLIRPRMTLMAKARIQTTSLMTFCPPLSHVPAPKS